LLWRHTSRKFALSNVHESLIWIVPGIFTTEKLKLPFAYASFSKWTVLRKMCCVFMVAAYTIKDLDDWL
jgi:hypothetical protein